MRNWTRLMMVGCVVLATGLAGCSSKGADSEKAREEGLVLQQQFLADGVVTEEELEASIRGFLQCGFDAGFRIAGPEWEAKRRIMVYKLLPHDQEQQSEVAEVFEKCYSAYAGQVDPAYQSATRFNYQGVEEDADLFRRCLMAVEWPGVQISSTPQEIDAAVWAAREDLGDPPCDNPFVPDPTELMSAMPFWES